MRIVLKPDAIPTLFAVLNNELEEMSEEDEEEERVDTAVIGDDVGEDDDGRNKNEEEPGLQNNTTQQFRCNEISNNFLFQYSRSIKSW